jgi:hypothetical protein
VGQLRLNARPTKDVQPRAACSKLSLFANPKPFSFHRIDVAKFLCYDARHGKGKKVNLPIGRQG